MTQREQFEAWWKDNAGLLAEYKPNNLSHRIWNAAWQAADAAKDAENAELREKYEGLTTLFHRAFAERNALCSKIDVLEAKLAKCQLEGEYAEWHPCLDDNCPFCNHKEACGL